MSNSISLVGQKFGHLLVVSETKERSNGCKVWECACDCGKIKKMKTGTLKSNRYCSVKCPLIEWSRTHKLEGQKFGKLLVLKKIGKRKKKNLWLCKCECGEEVEKTTQSLVDSLAKSCGCLRFPEYHGKVLKSAFNLIKWNAEIRELEFVLTLEYLDELFKKQEEKCALSGVLIKFSQPGYAKNKNLRGNASLDRIDCKKGYVEGNVQWVDKRINRAKQEFSDEEFIDICITVAKFQNKVDENTLIYSLPKLV